MWGTPSLSLRKANRWGWREISSHKQREWFLFFFLFYWPSGDWKMPVHTGEDDPVVLSPSIQMPVSSRNILKTYPEILLYQLSGNPLIWSGWHLRLTIVATLFQYHFIVFLIGLCSCWLLLSFPVHSIITQRYNNFICFLFLSQPIFQCSSKGRY